MDVWRMISDVGWWLEERYGVLPSRFRYALHQWDALRVRRHARLHIHVACNYNQRYVSRDSKYIPVFNRHGNRHQHRTTSCHTKKISIMFDILNSIVFTKLEQRRRRKSRFVNGTAFCFGLIIQKYWKFDCSPICVLGTPRFLKTVLTMAIIMSTMQD